MSRVLEVWKSCALLLSKLLHCIPKFDNLVVALVSVPKSSAVRRRGKEETMPQLETVEDFEKVDKALSNPDSKLSEYCVVNYGYCSFCKSIAAFDAISVRDEDNLTPTVIRCCVCQNHFLPDYMGLSYLYCPTDETRHGTKHIFQFMLNTEPEPQSRAERKFFSRGHQRELFNQLLESRIRELKREQRALAGKIRRLAKLRS